MLRYVTVGKFAAESGYTEEAIRAKIKNGVWLQDVVWIKAPDGRILVDIQGYENWVESGSPAQQLKALRELAGRAR